MLDASSKEAFNCTPGRWCCAMLQLLKRLQLLVIIASDSSCLPGMDQGNRGNFELLWNEQWEKPIINNNHTRLLQTANFSITFSQTAIPNSKNLFFNNSIIHTMYSSVFRSIFSKAIVQGTQWNPRTRRCQFQSADYSR